MPHLRGGKRSEVDVLPLLRLGISNPHGSSSSAHQLSEKGGRIRREDFLWVRETISGLTR
jgi:hypothetical protein